MKSDGYAGLFLRIGLAFVFLYFGIDKFASPRINEATFQNLWFAEVLPLSVASQVVISGVVELSIGVLLAFGVFNSFASLASAVWTFVVFLTLGWTGGTYDLALAFMGIALYFTGPGRLKLNYLNEE